MLTEGHFFDVLRQAIWVAVLLSMPILSIALIMGLVIGLFQALTSIQEMTLTFVPKLAAMLIVFWATMGFMTQSLVSFFHTQILPAILGG